MTRRSLLPGLLALALVLPIGLVGCVGESTVEQGYECSTFDTDGGPAGMAELELSGPKPRPAVDAFVLSIEDAGGDTVNETRFHEDGCVGFDLPEDGEYTFTAEAPHPEDEDCRWQDSEEASLEESGQVLRVELHPRPYCT